MSSILAALERDLARYFAHDFTPPTTATTSPGHGVPLRPVVGDTFPNVGAGASTSARADDTPGPCGFYNGDAK